MLHYCSSNCLSLSFVIAHDQSFGSSTLGHGANVDFKLFGSCKQRSRWPTEVTVISIERPDRGRSAKKSRSSMSRHLHAKPSTKPLADKDKRGKSSSYHARSAVHVRNSGMHKPTSAESRASASRIAVSWSMALYAEMFGFHRILMFSHKYAVKSRHPQAQLWRATAIYQTSASTMSFSIYGL